MRFVQDAVATWASGHYIAAHWSFSMASTMKLAAAGNSPLYIPLPLLMVEARSPVVPTTPYEGRAGPMCVTGPIQGCVPKKKSGTVK